MSSYLPNIKIITSSLFFIFILLITLTCVVYYFLHTTSVERQCKGMANKYNNSISISSLKSHPGHGKYKLIDFYINSASNCAAVSPTSVNTCAIKTCLSQGVRLLDFQVQNMNNRAVVTLSSGDNTFEKASVNHIPLKQVLKTINKHAFNSTSPNANDPLILHIRIMTNNRDVVDEIASNINRYINSNRLLTSEYSYGTSNKNVILEPINKLFGKVIIFVNDKYLNIKDTSLYEFANGVSHNSSNIRVIRQQGIIDGNSEEMVDYHTRGFGIVVPDGQNSNLDTKLSFSSGAQSVCMNFNKKDKHLDEYLSIFTNQGRGFVLKPDSQRVFDKDKDSQDASYFNFEIY